MGNREKLSSRLGFILISAGCAIGLGNVWRFPHITGQYGGAAFVLVYLFFLVVLGLPVMTMEFAVGRASQASAATSFKVLEPKGTKWHIFGYFAMIANYLLMMFYTVIAGWMLLYTVKMIKGEFTGLDAAGIGEIFGNMVSEPVTLTVWMVVAVLIGFAICALGLQNGVEKITKVMMSSLFVILLILVVRSVTLPGAAEGLRFYLMPDFGKMMEHGFFDVVSAAMGQAFFTLSIGIGSMAIFGSYLGKDRSLMGESVNILVLDTFVAIVAGLIIFPACFTFDVEPAAGPSLLFEAMASVFNNMKGGRWWGSLFFLFMFFAAMTTVIAVMQNILACVREITNWGRIKGCIICGISMLVLSVPCALGFNLWSEFKPFGSTSSVLDLEDFLVTNCLLPVGALCYVLFCVTKKGWGFDNFLQEANTGKGMKLKRWMRPYMTYVLPAVIVIIFITGILNFQFDDNFTIIGWIKNGFK